MGINKELAGMFKKPRVTLANQLDGRQTAWKYSRPTFDHSNLDMEQIGSIDISLNSIASYVLEIESSQKFRDLMFSLRPSQIWARSLRSAPLDLENLSVSSEYEHDTIGFDACSMIYQCIASLKETNNQDDARGLLPEQLSVAYTIMLDRRTLLSFVRTLQKYDAKLYLAYGILMLRASGLYEEYVKLVTKNKIKDLMSYYEITEKEYNLTNTIEVGEMIYSNSVMSSVLMSHYLRQSNSLVKTDLWTELRDGRFCSGIATRQNIKRIVVSYQQTSAYIKNVKSRSHWFSDWDEWSDIVEAYTNNMDTHEFYKFLPQSDGEEDPYYADMMSRITLDELNYPDPFMTESPEFIKLRSRDLHYNNYLCKRYADIFDQHIVVADCSNPLREQYLVNLANAKNDLNHKFKDRIEKIYNNVFSSSDEMANSLTKIQEGLL